MFLDFIACTLDDPNYKFGKRRPLEQHMYNHSIPFGLTSWLHPTGDEENQAHNTPTGIPTTLLHFARKEKWSL
jgi:hypothetical protein